MTSLGNNLKDCIITDKIPYNNMEHLKAVMNDMHIFVTASAEEYIDIIVHIDKDLRQKIFSILTLNKLSIS